MWGPMELRLPAHRPCNREIVEHAAGVHKNARLVKSVFATLDFPLGNIEVFHADRGSEFDSMAIDELLDFFCIKRSLSKKGAPTTTQWTSRRTRS